MKAILAAPSHKEPLWQAIRAAMLARQSIAAKPPTDTLSLLDWTQSHRVIHGKPMQIPGPLRELYDVRPGKIVFMKGAQIGASEYAINLCLWAAATKYGGRGNTLYVQPTGGNAGDFVQGRVNPAITESDAIEALIGQDSRSPDKVGLRQVGEGFTYWRTARSRSGLKSVPADVLVLDEYENMPAGTLALAEHRLDSAAAPLVVIVSTPEYSGGPMETEYLAGDQRRYFLPCPKCHTDQALEWDKNVDLETMTRVCVECRASIESVIAAAWEGEAGYWRPTSDGGHRSYHLSQLYRPVVDLAAIQSKLTASDIELQQEAWNQHLGLPFSPPGGQLSLEELQRISVAPFSHAGIAGVPNTWMGVDVGARLHVTITWDDTEGRTNGTAQRWLVGAYEVDTFQDVGRLMERFATRLCVIDAHPETHLARTFALEHPGKVYLCNYVKGRVPPDYNGREGNDPKQWYSVSVDRTSAMDAVFGALRGGAVLFPNDAESIPGFFSQLQAPVRKLIDGPDGNKRAVYEEGAKADHYTHALLYAELAAFIGRTLPRGDIFDVRTLSTLGQWENRL